MERIKLHDKYFKIFIPNEEVEKSIKKVADRLNEDYKNAKTPVFLSVLNGSFMFTASLLKNTNFLSELSFIKLTSYCGTSSTGEIKEILGLTQDLKGRSVIIVEDIVDTGKTISELNNILIEAGAKEVKVCTLFLKPDAYKEDVPIDYAALEIGNDFIVGYGLDYDQLGRQLKDVYILD